MHEINAFRKGLGSRGNAGNAAPAGQSFIKPDLVLQERMNNLKNKKSEDFEIL